MNPASGPVHEPKMVPAATMEDQEAVANEEVERQIVMGAAPFSSPDPETDAIKMLPLEDGTSSADAKLQAANLAEAEAAGKGGESALPENVADWKAADFKSNVEAATTQEELDEAAQTYSESGKEFSTVEDAIEKKQEEIDGAANGGDEA